MRIFRPIGIVWILAVALQCLSGGRLAAAPIIATVDQPIASATFVNIYWDSSWDSDNPTLTRERIDAVTSAITQSTYFGGLSEYGVKTVVFGGSFPPNKACPQKAPDSVGFYDPVNTSIAGFIQCEHDHEQDLQNSSIIYNIILPQSSLESDAWSQNFCSTPNSEAAWHYHGLQSGVFRGGPVYTITQTNPKCIGSGPSFYFALLTHEMVESLTDPFPVDISIFPPHVRVAPEDEIADKCEKGTGLPNAGTPAAFVDASGNSPISGGVQLSNYWSNAQQTCLSFTDKTMPAFTNASVNLTNLGPQLTLGIKGSGFGTTSNGVGMLTLNDNTDSWQAGNLINQNSIQFSGITWLPTQITAFGLAGLSSSSVTSVGASLTVWVCNPNSLNCQSASVPPPCFGLEARNSAGVCSCPIGTTQTASGACECGAGFVWDGLIGACLSTLSNNGPSLCPAACKFGCDLQTKVCNALPPRNVEGQ